MADFHLMTILEIEQIRDGKVIWQAQNLKNVLHDLGEKYILDAAFTDTTVVPTNFYFGLDNRTSVDASDTMADLTDEPSTNGYARQSISSDGEFTVALNDSSIYEATSPIINFSASGGSWGPVNALFLTTSATGSGILIATVSLTSSLTANSGDSFNMRLGLALSGGS